MNAAFICAFLLMGFTFTATQGLFVREFLVVFAGNELSIGLLLGNWLILEAIGSWLLGRLAERAVRGVLPYVALQVAFAVALFPALYAAMTVRQLLGAIPGEGSGLLPIAGSTFLILAPLGLVDGAMFTVGCRAYSLVATGKHTVTIGQVYVYEALGAILGGLVFSFVFVPYLSALQMALLLGALNLISAASLLALSGRRPLALALAPFLAALLYLLIYQFPIYQLPIYQSPISQSPTPPTTTLPQSDGTPQDWLARRQWEWPGYTLRYYRNSIYGNLAVLQREEQYTFYENGLPVLTTPVPDIATVEELAHLPLLFSPTPREVPLLWGRVLVIGGGVGGLLAEVLKHPVEQVDYAELDPLLIEAVRTCPTPLTAQELSDPRVRVYHVDGRLLVKEKSWELRSRPQEKYRVLIVNLPYPSTLQINRFYTEEFFRLARDILTDDGLLAISLPASLSYLSPEMRDLNSSLYHTLQVVFPYVRIVPGDLALYLASTSGDLMAVTPATLLQRGEERELRTRLVNETYLHYKFDATRLAWFQKQTSEVSPPNSDLRPVGVFYGLAYWSALFSPAFRGYFSLIGHLSLPLVALPLLGLALVFLAASEVPLLRGRLAARRRGWPVPTAIAATGFAGMSFDLIIIFAFQAFYGYVYHRVGLLIPAFMAGLSLGGWLMTRRAERGEMTRRHLMRVEAAVLLYAIFLAGALWGLAKAVTLPEMTAESRYFGAVVQPLLLLLNMAGGFLVGLEFPLAGHLLLQENSERERLRIGTISQTAGLLYAADLVGAFVGAVVVTIALLPVLGVIGTCIFLAALKAVTYSALA